MKHISIFLFSLIFPLFALVAQDGNSKEDVVKKMSAHLMFEKNQGQQVDSWTFENQQKVLLNIHASKSTYLLEVDLGGQISRHKIILN